MMRFRWLALLFVVALVMPARAQAPELEVRTYVVQPGDSVWSIAYEFYGSGEKYPLIYRYNDFVAKPPFLLKPGQLLRLPIIGLGPEARLDWLLRDVKAKPPRTLDWLEARQRMNLWRLYRVATGDESAAHIVFEDTTDLKLRENALLVIYGASASAARTARRDKTEVMLVEGTIQGGLATLDEGVPNQRPLVIKTPSGQVDLLARLAQVQADIAASIVSVYDGAATVIAMGAAVDVKGGEGTVVKKGKRPEPARPLPDAPLWVDAQPALVAVLAGQQGSWEASWQAAPQAETYRVELGTDETFKQLLFDAEIGAGVTRLRLAELKPGRYAVRVSTRDAAKLESRPGAARVVEVLALEPQRAVEAGPDGTLEAVGFLEMHIGAELRESTTHSIDGGAERPGREPIRLTTAGAHVITLRSGAAVTAMTVRVLGVAATLDVVGEPIARGADAELLLTVSDERGREALLPGLVLEASGGTALPIEAVPGGYRARLPANDGSTRVALRASWLGGELVRREVAYQPPPEAPALERAALAMTPHRPSRLAPGPLLGPRPETRLALETMAAHVEGGPGAFALALDGELALGRLGLGARLVAQDVRLAEETSPQSEVQDLALSLRFALGGDTFVLTPYLRVAAPLGLGHEQRRFGFEPGALLRLELGALLFDLRLALLVVPALSDEALRAAGLAALTWQASALLSLSLSGDSVIPFGGEARHLVGLGLNLHLGDVRLGLSFGLGLGAHTRDDFAAMLGRLVIDIGFLR